MTERRLPVLVSSMKPDELQDFKRWLSECCGYNFNECSENLLWGCAVRYYEELYQAIDGIE